MFFRTFSFTACFQNSWCFIGSFFDIFPEKGSLPTKKHPQPRHGDAILQSRVTNNKGSGICFPDPLQPISRILGTQLSLLCH